MSASSSEQISGPIPYWRLSGFYFFYFGLLGVWLPFWPLYLQELGFTADKIGYIAGAMMATKIIAPNVWGFLADRTGQRMRIIRLGSLLALLIFLVIFWRQDFLSLLLIVIGYSFFWNAVLPQFDVATLSHLRGRYQYYSHIRLWGSVGFIVAVGGLGLFFDHISVRWLPWILALMLAGIWLTSLLLNDRCDSYEANPQQRALWRAVKQPAVIAFLAVCFLLQVSHGPYYAFFSVYLIDHGFSRTITGGLWSLGVAAEVVVFIFMHRLLQRFSLYQIMLASLSLSVLRWWLIAWFVDVVPVLVFAQVLHAASFGTLHAISVEVIRKMFAGGLQGQGMALYSGISFGAGGAVGAICSGWLWEYDASLTFVLAGCACLLALMIGSAVKHQSLS